MTTYTSHKITYYMNKSNYPSCMGQNSYAAPKCEILEIKTEGVLCYSSSADDIYKDDELNDYEQIF